MKKYLFFIIFILFILSTSFVLANDIQSDCAREGEEGDVSGKNCCEGLIGVAINNVPLPSGLCPSVLPSYGTQFYCIKCGDGICGEKENKCNCPEDCNESGEIKNCPDSSSVECEGGKVVLDEVADENGCFNFKCIKELSNGQPAEIKITPGFASEVVSEKVGNLNFNIQLQEAEENSDLKFVYQTDEKEKEVRIFGIFKVKIKVSAQIDALTGETRIKMPWWSIFAW
jgi:hypothetical protein